MHDDVGVCAPLCNIALGKAYHLVIHKEREINNLGAFTAPKSLRRCQALFLYPFH